MQHQMQALPFDNEMIRRALGKARKIGNLRKSILNGKGILAGLLGEEVLAQHLNAIIVSRTSFNHDLMLPCGKRIEVKTTRRTVPPLPHYNAVVKWTAMQHQVPDVFAFMSIHFGMSMNRAGERGRTYYRPQTVWLCGFMEPDDLVKHGKILNKNDSDSPHFKTSAKMVTIPIGALRETPYQ